MKRRVNMTPAEKEEARDIHREYMRNRNVNLTQAERDEMRQADKLRKRVAWANATPEQKKANAERVKRYRENMTPEMIIKDRKNKRKWQANRPPEERRSKSLTKYGLTIKEYQNMIEEQGGLCAMCGMKLLEGTNHPVDHDHALTGRESVRGIIHYRCNTLLGCFERNMELLRKAEIYIKKHNQRTLDLGLEPKDGAGPKATAEPGGGRKKAS